MNQKKIVLYISIIINVIFLICLFYILSLSVIPKETIHKFSDNGIIISRVYKDKNTGTDILLTETKGFYPNGNIRYKGIMLNGTYESFTSYSKEGDILGRVIMGKGQLIVPNYDGKISAKNTVFPFKASNCYYRGGEPLTEEEFNRRKKIQRKRLKKLHI